MNLNLLDNEQTHLENNTASVAIQTGNLKTVTSTAFAPQKWACR